MIVISIKQFQEVHALFGDKDLLPKSDILSYLADEICSKEIPGRLCENVLFLLAGYDDKNMNQVS